MGYPVAYRKGAEAFQPLNPDKYTRPDTKPGPLPVPDNDNEPPRPKSGVPPSGGGRAVGRFRTALRRHLIGLAVDVAEEALHQWWSNPQRWNPNGWTLKFGPCVPPYTYPRYVGLLSYSGVRCLGGQALDEKYVPKESSLYLIGAYAGAARYYVYVGWTRTAAQRAVAPRLFPAPQVMPEEIYAPAVPLELPWLQPQPQVWPLTLPKLPWPLVALRPNTPTYDRGYAVPASVPRVIPAPSVAVPLWPRGPAGPVLKPPPVIPAPPGPKVKEKKARTAGYGVANAVVGAATEGVDVLEALWDALPRNRQTREKGKKTTPQQKALDLYRGWQDIDVAAAVKNLVANELKDRAIGTIGQAVGKAAAKAKPHGDLPIGFQTGAWDNGVFF